MTSHIYLDTRTSNGSSNYNTHWDVYNPRLNVLDSFRVSVRTIEFPNLVYPTNAFNNVIEILETDNPNVLTITMTPNVYTGTTFASALQVLLNDVGNVSLNNWTVTFDSVNQKLTITATELRATPPDPPKSFTFAIVSNSAYESMGLDLNTFSSLYTTVTGAFPVHLSGTQYVDVVTNISNLSFTSRGNGHVMCRVPVIAPFASTVFYKNDFNDHLQTSMQHLDQISVRLYDDHGNEYQLPDNAHVSIVFNIEPDGQNFNHARNYS